MLTPQIFRLVGATTLSLVMLVLAGMTSGATVSARTSADQQQAFGNQVQNDLQWRKGSKSRFAVRRASFRRFRRNDDRKHGRHFKYSKKWNKHNKHNKHNRRHDRR